MLSADAMVIQVVANRLVQLTKQKFDQHFDVKEGSPGLANLYAKAGDISKEIIDKADELHTCLILIEEMEKQ